MTTLTSGQAGEISRACPALSNAQVGTRIKDNETQIATNVTALNTVNAEPKTIVAKITADASAGIAVSGLAEGDEIVAVSVICTVANANGTLILETGADDDITDGIICAVDKVVTYAGTIDDANSTLPATGAQILSVGGTAANTRGIMVITYIPA